MNTLILAGVGVTVLLVLIVGVFVGRKVDGDSANYLVAGRSLPLGLVACSLTAAAVDSNAIVGNTDLTGSLGFWAGASLAIGMAIALLLSGLFVAKPMNSMGLFTLGDFFRVKYGRKVEVLASVIMVFAYVILFAGNMVACGVLLEYFIGIPYLVGICIAVALVLSYTIAGGLFSDAYTAAIQTCLTVGACIAIGVYTFVNFGISAPEGFGAFDFAQLTSADYGAPINWATLLSLGIGDIVAIDFQQRIFGAKDPKTAQRACYTAAFLTAVIGIVFAYVILTAINTIGVTNSETSYLFAFLGEYCPPIITVAVLSGVVAASFSTASGAILAMSGIIVRNIGGSRRVVKNGERDPQLFNARLAMIPLCLLGIALAAVCSDYTGILLVLAFDFMLCCLIPALIGGLYFKKSSTPAVMSSIILGFTMRIFFLLTSTTIYGYENVFCLSPVFGASMDGWVTFISFLIPLALYTVICFASPRTRAEDDAELHVLAELAVERGEYDELESAHTAQKVHGSDRIMTPSNSPAQG